MNPVHTSAKPDDDGLYQEGAAQIAAFQHRVEIDEHSAQGDDLEDDLEPARRLALATLIGFALLAGIAAGVLIGRFIIGGLLT